LEESKGKSLSLSVFLLVAFFIYLDKKVCIAKHLFAIQFQAPKQNGTLREAFLLLERGEKVYPAFSVLTKRESLSLVQR
jgi:hypothetical protein